jgi:hypothetical protein
MRELNTAECIEVPKKIGDLVEARMFNGKLAVLE